MARRDRVTDKWRNKEDKKRPEGKGGEGHALDAAAYTAPKMIVPAAADPRSHAVATKMVLDAAREAIERALPLAYRKNFSGQADHEYRTVEDDYVVVITLTHGCGERFRSQMNFTLEEAQDLNHLNAIGHGLGHGLALLMDQHRHTCEFTTPKEHAPFSTTRVNGTFDEADRLPKAEPEPPKSLIPEKVCPICGPSDWEDECEHEY